MDKKYKFTGETKTSEDGVSVTRRIQALKDFGTVRAGELGGWIEKEENLSHFNDCWVSGDAQVHNNARVSGNALVSGDAEVYGKARVYGDAWVHNNAQVHGNAWVYGNARVFGKARVYGDAWVYGDARVYNKAQVEASSDVIVITNIGSRNGATTFYRNKHGGISVVCGCFAGTLEEFEKAVSEKHGDNKHGRVYELAIKMAKEQIELE